MKHRSFIAVGFVVLFALLLCAKDKSALAVYDQTGVLSFSSFADYSASYHDSSGTYSVYCNSTENHVDCSEGIGAGYFVKLPDGSLGAVDSLALDLDATECVPGFHCSDFRQAAQDPLFDVSLDSGPGPRQITFRWRFANLNTGKACNPSDRVWCKAYICSPFNPNLPLARYSRKHQTEACYKATFGDLVPRTAKLTPQQVITNSELGKGSPAAAAAAANEGHVLSPQELADRVQKGQASKCAVVTVPPGAEVEIDGNNAGVTPLVFVLLRRGDTQRTITIKMSGYKTVEKKVVPDGKVIPFGLTLERQ